MTGKNYHACQGRFGFTLIEILVVIVIITLLTAILFPVFSKARESGRRTTCLSNMKQMGLGILQYVQDNDEDMPYEDENMGTVASPVYESWRSIIYPYVNNAGVYECPDNTLDTSSTANYYDNPTSTMPGKPALRPGYGCNEVWQNGAYWTDSPFEDSTVTVASVTVPNPPMNVSKFLNPAELIAVGEQMAWVPYIYGFIYNDTPSNGCNTGPTCCWSLSNPTGTECYSYYEPASATHAGFGVQGHGGGTTNFLFCDGHAKSMHPSATYVPTNLWANDQNNTWNSTYYYRYQAFKLLAQQADVDLNTNFP